MGKKILGLFSLLNILVLGIAWTALASAGTGSADSNIIAVDTRGISGTGSAESNITTVDTRDFTLTVTKSGSGSGQVAGNPAGIDCGGTCTAQYLSGTSVVLTANPASGSSFTGWSGDCSGTGSCSVAMSQARNVTATFVLSDTTKPTITTFRLPTTSKALTVAITTVTATDNVAVTGYMVTETSTAPATSASGWTVSAPTSYTFTNAGSKTLYAWAKDAAGNVSASASASVTITLPDTTSPVVTAFTVPATATSLTVSITAFTATDNVGVTGYLATESATAPAANAAGWSATLPTTYTFAAGGTKTLYAWAKDGAGNVSTSRSAIVNIQFIHGDINGDNVVDLKDGILALQVLAGLNPSGIGSDYLASGKDVDGNNKIGLAEVIYIFQKVGGIR